MEASIDLASASPAVLAWVQTFVEKALQPAEVDAFVREIDADILEALPVLAGDPTLVEELHASTREHWRNFLVGLSGEHRLALPPAAIALSLSIARRHFDIDILLKVYRVANRTVFRYVAAHTDPEALPGELRRDEALLALWLRAERWIDDSIEQLIDHYTRERASLQDGTAARRAEAIEGLISGVLPTAESERVLSHSFTGWQTAFILSAPPIEDVGPPLFDVALRICQKLGLPRPLTTLAGSRELWGWISTPTNPSFDLASVSDVLRATGLHLAIGSSVQGPTAFRTSHVQALATHHIGLNASAPSHRYDDVELASLIGNGELAQAMIRRELGSLLKDTKGNRVVRETVQTYLRSGQRVDLTAGQLFIHPNTVRYRLTRAEEALGHPIGRRASLLETCLAWVDVYGTVED